MLTPSTALYCCIDEMLGEDQAPLHVDLWFIVTVLTPSARACIVLEQTAYECIGTLKTKCLRRVE